MNVCKTGLNKLHAFIPLAPGDIRHRLWSLYWLARMTHTPDGRIIELGTRGGDSTRAFLCACMDMDGKLVSYDIEDCSKAVTDTELLPFWKFYQGNSDYEGVWFNRNMPVDLVFVDTDHTFDTTCKEVATWSPHVRVGGCMVFHDYWLADSPRDGVKPAVDKFIDFNHPAWTLETWDRGPEGDTGGAVLWRVS